METNAPAKPTTRDVWMRGLSMLILVIGFAVGQWLLNFIALVQFLWLLRTRAQRVPCPFRQLSCYLARGSRALSHLRHRRQAVPVESMARLCR
jgi:Domain of unknown function (DUF4389)